MLITPKRIFVLAPHTDNAEPGAGGSMTKWLEVGVDLYVVAFSTAEEPPPNGSAPTWPADECHASLDVLGVKPENRQIMYYPVRRLDYYRQEMLENMVAMERQLSPEQILIPSGADLHQDHIIIHDETIRAFKHKTLLGYELPWNHITLSASAFVTLDKRHLDKKWGALTKYTSQLEMGRAYPTKEFHESLAKVRGLQVKHDRAEVPELVRVAL